MLRVVLSIGLLASRSAAHRSSPGPSCRTCGSETRSSSSSLGMTAFRPPQAPSWSSHQASSLSTPPETLHRHRRVPAISSPPHGTWAMCSPSNAAMGGIPTAQLSVPCGRVVMPSVERRRGLDRPAVRQPAHGRPERLVLHRVRADQRQGVPVQGAGGETDRRRRSVGGLRPGHPPPAKHEAPATTNPRDGCLTVPLDSTAPTYQLFRATPLTISPSWRSRDAPYCGLPAGW